jgi:metal-sulfur cluster biosynthetic enzyme
MNQSIQDRIDAALAAVKEPQSLMSPVDLGLIEKLSYSESDKKLICLLAVGSPRFQCPACSAINGVIKESLHRDIDKALSDAFPGWEISVR